MFIAHEAAPHLNDQGVVMSITMSLGGQLTTNAPIDFSEVWAMEDTGRRDASLFVQCVRVDRARRGYSVPMVILSSSGSIQAMR